LVELLVVIVIIAVLAAILLPVVGRMTMKSYETKCLAGLRQHSLAFNLYAADNDGYLPAGAPEGPIQSWWLFSLKPYFTNAVNDDILGKSILDPYYYKLINEANSWWRPGWGMNVRMGLAVGDNAGQYNPISSRYLRYKMLRYPGNTILLGPSYWEAFSSDNNGVMPDERFSPRKTYTVPHNRRIGADAKGQNGTSAYYLTVSGSALNLKPSEAKELLKLRTAN